MLTLIFWCWSSSFVSFCSETTNSVKLLPPYCHPLVSTFRWSVLSLSMSALMLSIIRFDFSGIGWSRISEEVAPSGRLELMAIYYESRVSKWRGRNLQACPKGETISPCDSIHPELDDPTKPTRDITWKLESRSLRRQRTNLVSHQSGLMDADGGLSPRQR